MVNQKLIVQDKKRMRNLLQYRDLSDEEFNEQFDTKIEKGEDLIVSINSEEVEVLIEEKLVQFSEDYDLSDMKINDKLVLRNLIRSIISLEDFENSYEVLRRNPFNRDNIIVFDRISNVMSRLRSDISNMQDDLKLTRRIRKDSREEDFITYLENLKAKARKFYKQKSLHIFCPECNFLLATVWLLYPNAFNTLHLVCQHEKCGNTFEIELSKLYETDNKNLENVEMP